MIPVTSVSLSSTIVSARTKYNLVFSSPPLTDMPICDGVEACKRLRVMENKRKVPGSLPSA